MSKDISIIERDPLSNSDIKQYLPDAKIMAYRKLKLYENIDDLLPETNDYAIILYEHSINNGHWICLLKSEGNSGDTPLIEYFDSYGNPPDFPLNWVMCETRKKLGSGKMLLTRMLDNCPYNVIYNPIKYQSKNPVIATCGRHCVFRILNMLKKNMDLPTYYKMMKNYKKRDKTDYDAVVSKYISLVE